MKQIQVGILGFGTVGAGVAELLINKRDLIRSRAGCDIIIKAIADLDIETDRGIPLGDDVLTTDAHAVVTHPEIDIIIELIGGTSIADELISTAIKHGKHIVTANKALIADKGKNLFDLADENDVDLAYEASVGGCMPIIKSIRESLVANDIIEMTGILNGTCNYILTQITQEGLAFDVALKNAQEKGYAEADPTFDIEGTDTAHKLTILAALAFGTEIKTDDVFVEGISHLTPLDIEYARQFGYRIKLLAVARNHGDRVEVRVHPTMISESHILASVHGSLNAIDVCGDAVGDMLLYGHGAGMLPTASAVLSDTVDIARNLLTGSKRRIPGLSYQPAAIKQIPVMPISEIETHYYIRFTAADQPGVLSKIAGILGDYNISIQSVHQKGRDTHEPVPIVMLTHMAKEENIQKALSVISAAEYMNHPPMVIRIKDDESIH